MACESRAAFSIGDAWLQGAGHAVGTKPRIYTGLLADGPGRTLRPALRVKPGYEPGAPGPQGRRRAASLFRV